jgi:hypothetical protein
LAEQRRPDAGLSVSVVKPIRAKRIPINLTVETKLIPRFQNCKIINSLTHK